MWRTAAVSTVALITLGAPLALQAQASPPDAPTKKAAQPGTPFSCQGQIMVSAGSVVDDTVQLFLAQQQQAGSVAFVPLGPVTGYYDAIGVDTTSRFLYGIDQSPNLSGPAHLIRVDATGTATDLGPIAGLPANPGALLIGAFDNAGNYYVQPEASNQLSDQVYVIDPDTNTVTRTLTLSQPTGRSDWAFVDGYFWQYDHTTHIMNRIDPNTGQVTQIPFPDGPDDNDALFAYGNGDLGLISSAGVLTRVAINNGTGANPTVTVVSEQTSPGTLNMDATSCFLAETDLSLTKTSKPSSYRPGQTITYTLTVTNNGPNPSSGYTVTDAFPAGLTNVTSTTPGCTVTGQDLSCTGAALPVGQSRDITVTATVGPNQTATLTNQACVRGNDPDTNANNNCDRVPLTPKQAKPKLKVKKWVSKEHTQPGREVNYTFEVANTSDVPATNVTATDDLSDVLDDADYNNNAQASTGNVNLSDSTLTWTGDLDAGETATITYSVTVDGNGGGDHRLHNTVRVEAPGTNCADDDRSASRDSCTAFTKTIVKGKHEGKHEHHKPESH
ncbi:DUF11 domain-containing protein [Streptomyces sp. ISL-44]|uniref:DUF11 domain-containing protein n=1 Tax=Streptomyces sp. ISL-44 TaxID=2819184 RepID=UPI001BE94C92|nr:DUF11 domain-containing protein [Streptomyces sp. ISL-44]MBT2545496.1 DUF11 domain-containing protein [Streptomyces sp. ISL-44]